MLTAGEAEEQGYADEYRLEDFEVSAADYIKAQAVPNFRNAWEELDAESELVDDYDLGKRDSLQVCVPKFAGLWHRVRCAELEHATGQGEDGCRVI